MHITILQHSLEKKHPLNTAKIAKLGLRNVDVFSVSDVMFEAQFVIRPLEQEFGLGLLGGECTLTVCENASESFGSGGNLEVGRSRKRAFNQPHEVVPEAGCLQNLDSELFSDCPPENVNEFIGFEGNDGALTKKDDHPIQQPNRDMVCGARVDDKLTATCDGLNDSDAKKCSIEPVINITVGKYGKITSFSHPWKLTDEGNTPNFEHAIASSEAIECLARGFLVTKLRKQQNGGSIELEQSKEFKIKVPPGSALLFPAQKSTPIEAVDFEVKNLIVLDGTWSKANRIYNENPWLKILPCVKLEIEKMSMFCEVRREPKPGYLSTIESIVYALEALGVRENVEGLHNLLNVFESMVEDQRRCKDERLKKLSSS